MNKNCVRWLTTVAGLCFNFSTASVADDVRHLGTLEVSGLNQETLVSYLKEQAEKVDAGHRIARQFQLQADDDRYRFQSAESPHRGVFLLWEAPQSKLQRCAFIRIDQPEDVVAALGNPPDHPIGKVQLQRIGESKFRHTVHALADRAVVRDGKSVIEQQPTDRILYSQYFRIDDSYLTFGNTESVWQAPQPSVPAATDTLSVNGWFDLQALPPVVRQKLFKTVTAGLLTRRQSRDRPDAQLRLAERLQIDAQLAIYHLLFVDGGQFQISVKNHPDRKRISGSAKVSVLPKSFPWQDLRLPIRTLRTTHNDSRPIELWAGIRLTDRVREIAIRYLQSLADSNPQQTDDLDRYRRLLDTRQIELLMQVSLQHGSPECTAVVRTDAVEAMQRLVGTVLGETWTVESDPDAGLVFASTSPQMQTLRARHPENGQRLNPTRPATVPRHGFCSVRIQPDLLRSTVDWPEDWSRFQFVQRALQRSTATFGQPASTINLAVTSDQATVEMDVGHDLAELLILLLMLAHG